MKWVKEFAFTLTLFFPMFPFDPLENIRKPWVFREIQREHWEENG